MRIHDVLKAGVGYDGQTTERIIQLYERIVYASVHAAPNIKIAEMAKAFKNVQREPYIAPVNRLATVCERLDLNATDDQGC